MTHALNNASHTSVCAELGISVGTNRTQTSLTRHASINKWSFYRSGSIAPDVSDYVQLTAPSNNDKLGDFRGYNHSAATPATPNDYTKNWGPGGSTITLTFNVTVGEMNIREITGGSSPYITVKYYLSSSNRDAKTSVQRTYTVAFSETSNSPPTGHTNNQTQRPASGTQLVSDTAFPTSLLTTPDDIVYCDLFVSDVSGNEVARFGTVQADGHVDVDTHEYTNPFVDACGPNYSSPPSGYTFVAVLVTNSTSNKDGVDFVESNGSTTYGTFYWYVYGLKSGDSHYYRIGSSTVTAVLRIPGGTDTTIHTGALNAAGASSNESASGTLAASQTWAYDDEADVVITSANWSTITEYDLGTTSPTCT